MCIIVTLLTVALECIGDPHFVVPLLSKKTLCYSIQGYPDFVFNLIHNKNFVVNAQFIDSVDSPAEATWIGQLAVILQNNNKSVAVIFNAVDQDVTIVNIGIFKAENVKQIIFTSNGSVKYIRRVVMPSGNPTVHVVFEEPRANFDVIFYAHHDHLNVNWKMHYDEFPNMHGLMGKD